MPTPTTMELCGEGCKLLDALAREQRWPASGEDGARQWALIALAALDQAGAPPLMTQNLREQIALRMGLDL